jgi:hypothetical protein
MLLGNKARPIFSVLCSCVKKKTCLVRGGMGILWLKQEATGFAGLEDFVIRELILTSVSTSGIKARMIRLSLLYCIVKYDVGRDAVPKNN